MTNRTEFSTIGFMNTISTIIPANEARSNFYQLLEEVDTKLQQFIITLRGKAKAVIMSAEEFAGWQETLEILSDKNLIKSIKTGVVEMQQKKGVSEEKVNKLLKW